jgi:Holliday junction resolvase RusA-like endonuclease
MLAEVVLPGSPPTVNTVWKHRVRQSRGRSPHVSTYKNPSALPWIEAAIWSFREAALHRKISAAQRDDPDFLLLIGVEWQRQDRRRRDSDNILKVLGDVIQTVSGIDDSRFEWQTSRVYAKPERVRVRIWPSRPTQDAQPGDVGAKEDIHGV